MPQGQSLETKAMDLTPPLTRSPASTPKTCCQSEASSSDYPSPHLVEQLYTISSAFESGPACSMTPSVSPDCHSTRLGADAHPEWSPVSALHPALTAPSLTHVLTAEYDAFATYDGSYPNDAYAGRGPPSPNQSLPGSCSPVSATRPSQQYPPLDSPSNPGTPRLQPEDMASEYAHSIESSHYPSPTMGHEPYPGGASSHPSLPPLGPPQHDNTAYATEALLAQWPRSAEYPAQPDQLYVAGSAFQPSLMMPSKRSSPRGSGERPRRAPRKLTTKEEANFECDITGCGKFFSRSYNFKAHMETHREKRQYPFPCQSEDCTKRFVRKTDLQRHQQSVHMKERKHGCDYCGRMFARRDTLKRHKSDGCHRRFDLGTMDLQAEDQDQRELFSPPSLPPLAILPLSAHKSVVPPLSVHKSVEPPLRERGQGESDATWSR